MEAKIPSLGLLRNCFRLGLMVFFCFFFLPALGQQDKVTTVIVKEGQHIRDIAKEYLGDPDLWREILRVNHLASVTEVTPGMKLRIPSTIVSLAGAELAKSLEAIQEATRVGARLFTPEIISNAIRLRDEALERRNAGDWEGCLGSARSAIAEAERAWEESTVKNKVSGEAILNDRRGNVESRKEIDLIWNDSPLHSIFIEQEKVRTRSRSLAEILFLLDDSRLRLSENSQAVIQKMQGDLLKNKQESTISLIEGDLYALLAGSPKKKFNLDVPGVSTKINSTNFWVNRDSEAARFANYQGEMEVSAGGATIVLVKNQGTKVEHNQKPTSPKDLLPPPKLLLPERYGTVYRTHEKKEIALRWEAVPGAVGYWVEMALDGSTFKKVILSRKGIPSTHFAPEQLEDGVYYWRVAAADKEGFPGVKSEAWLVKVLTDVDPPYLLIHSPEEGAILRDHAIHVVGETEGDAVLTFQGRHVDISPTGIFEFQASLKEGGNNIVLEATDRAGNVNTLVRSVIFAPFKEIEIDYDASLNQVAPNHFAAQSSGFTCIGRTEPEASIEVQAISESFKAKTFSDAEQGNFAVSVPLMAGKNDFDLSVTTRAEYVREDRFTVEIDLSPPEIRLHQEPPRVVGRGHASSLSLEGRVIDGTTLELNGRDMELSDGRFAETIELKPGRNRIQLTATDLAGNAAFLEREVILDEKPPRLVTHHVSHEFAAGGERITITVFAEDESGMKKAAAFTLQAGDVVRTGHLRFCRAMQCYRRTVNLPKEARGKIKVDVRLEDYHGNEKTYRLE